MSDIDGLSTIRTLQLGMSWFAERPGGLDRYYCELLNHLPAVGVVSRGLVVGTSRVAELTHGMVRAVAPPDAKLWTRWAAMRREVAGEVARGGAAGGAAVGTPGRVPGGAVGEGHLDLIVSHHALYTFPVLEAGGVTGHLPMVVHFHGPYAAESSVERSRRLATAVKHWMERRTYARAVRCIVLSEAFATILHESYGVPRERIAVIPGGVDAGRFDPVETRRQARERLGWPVDRPIVLTVRRLFRRMGLENLIEAVAAVRQRVPDVLVMIAGKGWLEGELRQKIKSMGLSDHVRLLGFVPDADLPVAYRAADLTVVPTVSLEGFGLTTVESMAAGTPAMVTPVGGLPEVVGGLSKNLILADASPAAITTGLAGYFTGGLKLPKGQECQAFVRENFDWPGVAARVRSIYEEALAE